MPPVLSAPSSTPPCPPLSAPFPYFGGKRAIAPLLWQALGDVPNFVDPFCGSAAILLGRPHPPRTETLNDADAHIPNFYRALSHAPVSLARWCDNPVCEIELHAWHLWLVEPTRRAAFVEKLIADPHYYDLERAARWCWGLCQWIGGGWCSGDGPWQVEDGQLVHRPQAAGGGRHQFGVKRVLPHLGDAGMVVHRKRPHLGDEGNGIHALHAQGDALPAWFQALAARLRSVRVCCGDWRRVLTPSVTTTHGVTGVVLDPPYTRAERAPDLYTHDADVAPAVAQWAREHGDDPLFRIVLCGYVGEHMMPSTWTAVPWKANGGYGNQGHGRGRANARRECLWLSPHCLPVPQQLPLFGDV